MILTQNLIHGKDYPSKLEWFSYDNTHDFNLAIRKAVGDASPSTPPSPVGMAILLPKNGKLEGLALCIGQTIYVLRTKSGKLNKSRPAADVEKVLSSSGTRLVAIGMARLALHINHSLGYHVKGYEFFDDMPPGKDKIETPGSAAIAYINKASNSFYVDQLWDVIPADASTKALENLCLRAWITSLLVKDSTCSARLSKCVLADTSKITGLHSSCVYRMIKEEHKMEAARPRTKENDFSSVTFHKDGQLTIRNDRFKTRVRKSGKTKVELTLENGGIIHGRAFGVSGKSTGVGSSGGKALPGPEAKVKNVRVIGREELTNAERARDEFILHLLQGKESMVSPRAPFISHVWFPLRGKSKSLKVTGAELRIGLEKRFLNQSQSNVVEAMLSAKDPVVLVHGPPGTGKTSTISAAMREWRALRQRVWAVAQSNVGVKNIAESLAKHKVPFKLIVSKEFYYEWHEQIYDVVRSQLICTDKFSEELVDVEKLFRGTQIILCTLGTLSNPILLQKGVFGLVPVENLVVDEASQVGILDYLHLFAKFGSMKKVCFFGDPKQPFAARGLSKLLVPPYGQDAAPTLQSIFDLNHLQSQAYFLDTQYRMPVELGSFISKSVYSSALKSVHSITSPSCVTFVDVCNGYEEYQGQSLKNSREVQTIVRIVRKYFKKKDYCIITPYDAQRDAIAKALKEANLRFDNVFNVDSFQGNEADYVIVSVVRTHAPGFLKSKNRVNVMLTRCKKAMVVVTKRAFAQNQARKTLLGELVVHWESSNEKADAWIDWKDVTNGKADLLVHQEAEQALDANLATLTIASA